MNEILFRSATEVVQLVREKEISAGELTELLLARIDAVNQGINAVVELRAEEAMREAGAADGAVEGWGQLGPLHGVPMTVKDSFDVAGLHTTWGNPEFADYVAESDATLVRRLKDAGAIVVGKTNVHFMLADFGQTSNELFGVTNNPWDTRRTPGGSSGGGAAALAAGLTFLEYGSDLVGSIRIPASFCGVYGLKPSAGIVPTTGFQAPGTQPSPPELTYMSSVGPLACSATDLRTALEVTAGPEPPVSDAYAWRLAPPRRIRLNEFRVGFILDHGHAPVSSEVRAVLSRAIEAIDDAGASIVEGWPEGIDPVEQAESFAYHVGLFFAFHGEEQFERAPEFVEEERRRLRARAAWHRYFKAIDVFLTPANFTPAFPHDTRPFEERTISTPEGERPCDSQPFWIAQASLPGLPAAVPVGRTSGGLPVGAQVVGPLYNDGTVLTFADCLATVVGGYERPPDEPAG